MKNKVLLILLSLFCVSFAYASEEKIPIPPDQGWSDTNERSNGIIMGLIILREVESNVGITL